MHVVAIIHVDLSHLCRGNFCAPCTVKSFEKRCIVVNLIVPVHSAEDCCAIYI